MRINTFKGIAPKISTKLLGMESAITANNLLLESGRLVPIKTTSVEAALPDALRKNIYRYWYDYNRLLCGTSGLLATLQAATAGCVTVTINGTAYLLTGLVFTGLSKAQMATAIQTSLRTATSYYETVTYDAANDRFIIGTTQEDMGYLSFGYALIDRTAGTAIGNMTHGGGLAAAFDANTNQDHNAGAQETGASNGYIGKDWGAGNTAIVNHAIVYSSNNYGFCNSTATDSVTLTLQGSTDNFSSSIVDLATTTFTNVNSVITTKTLTASSTATGYRYHRIKITRNAGAGETYCAEVQFYGAGVTNQDLSTSTYMNGRTGGTATIDETESTEWLSWTEASIDVARSPTADDIFRRIYWTGETGGKLKCRGNFSATARDVYIPEPTGAGTITVSTIWNPATTTCTWSASGCASQVMTLTEFNRTATGYYFKYHFVSQVDSGLSSIPTPILTLAFPSPIGSKTASDIGTQTSMTSGGTEWAKFELTSISGMSTETHTGTSPAIVATWAAFDAEIVVNMNFRFPSTDIFYYLMTYVDDLGLEGPPSVISSIVNRLPDQSVAFSAIPVSTDANIRYKRLYRSNTGVNTSGFQYLTQLANATTTYTDWTRDAELSESFSMRENPPDNLLGLVAMPNGFFAAFKGKEVWFCDPYLPHSWKSSYMMTVDSDIVGLAVSGNDLYVLTEESPYIISGNSPSTMTQAKLPLFQSCISKRSIARVKNMVIYASPDGLVGLSGGDGIVLSENYYDKDSWLALTPSTMIGQMFDMEYFAFFGANLVIFDFSGSGDHNLTTCDQTTAGTYYDAARDKLYIISASNILIWEGGVTNRTMTWRSKDVQFPRPMEFNSFRLIADAYTATSIQLYAEKASVLTRTVTSSTSFRLPQLRKERVWSVRIDSSDIVDEFEIGTSMMELLKAK